MPFLRTLSALALLAVWLTATQHCGIEAAGLWEAHAAAAATPCCEGFNHCDHDGCETVESGPLKPSGGIVKAPAPTFVACLLASWRILHPPLAVAPPRFAAALDQPSDWLPVWTFVRRAAPAPRAPSHLG